MNIKSITAALALALFSCIMLSPRAQAANITGRINFNGTATLDQPNLNTANGVVAGGWSGTNTTAAGNTGNFAGVTSAQPVSFSSPWTFVYGGPGITNFWTFSDLLGHSFSFDLLSSSPVSATRSSTFLDVQGTGIIHETGTGGPYTNTFGTWDISFVDAAGGTSGSFVFSFAASSNALPEGGSGLALLGIGLIAVELIRRKVATA